MVRITSLAIVLLLGGAKLAAADCAMIEFNATVLTPAHTAVGEHGGIVVAQTQSTTKTEPGPKDWRYRDGTAISTPKVVAIAPGLDLYVPTLRAFTLELVANTTALVEVAVTNAKPQPLAAPAIKRVVYDTHPGRHAWAVTFAELVGDPPAGAVALVAFDKAGKPRSFGAVTANAKQVNIYNSSDCGGPYTGTVLSKTDDQIRLAWVDAAGTMSKQTDLLRVVRAPPEP